MITVELYARIKRAVMVDGLSRLEAMKQFCVHRTHDREDASLFGAARLSAA
jgi:hypothetical protein